MTKIILACLILLSPLPSIAHIGLSEINFKDEVRERNIESYIFYPTAEKATKMYAENVAFYGFDAAEGAKVSKDKLPLFILVHGTSGNWKNMSWLAKALAEEAIVISANFPNYTTGQATPESILKPWDQAKDVSFLIDAISESSFGKYIDHNKTVVIGNSLGGYTAMALSGAILDLGKYPDFCKVNFDKSCGYFEEALNQLSANNVEQAKQSLTDKRVKLAIALTPGFTESMTQESLTSLTTPILIISAEHDKNVPPKTHLSNIPDNIEQYQINEASHFSFLQLCKPNAIAILAEEGASFVCEDSKLKARAEVHQETLDQIRVFLSKHGF
ncbi:alpha/beta fold hydrolase [Psychromonas sp.]|nr:alpha/beta fold hydrolase [Psychromonas sp.]